MSVVVWVLGVGPDVLLDERRQGRLGQILVALDAGIDQKVYVVGLSARSLQTGLGRRDRQMQCAVTGAPTCSGDVEALNDCAHSGPPNPRPR